MYQITDFVFRFKFSYQIIQELPRSLVVFLISIGGWYNEYKETIKFWLGRVYKEIWLDLLLLFFSYWTESYDFSLHQLKFQITVLKLIITYFWPVLELDWDQFPKHFSSIFLSVYIGLWCLSGVYKFNIKWTK